MQSVDGAFGTDGVIAAEAEIGQLLFRMVGTGILQLVILGV